MNEIAKNDNRPDTRKPDPREVIDSKMKTKICGLLALGYSQNMAAKHVGCDSSTITRTAKRDPKFREQLADSQSDASIDALHLIRRTADQERYWRAAAWVLERRHPDEYGRRTPASFSDEEMIKVLDRMLQYIMPSVPAEKVDELMSEFEEEFCDVAEKAHLPLPEYEPPEEEPPEEEADDESPSIRERVVQPGISNQSQAAASPPPAAQATIIKAASPQVSTQLGQASTLIADRLAPKMAAIIAETGKRVSCLEQFVERRPKAAATANGRR